MDIKKRKFEGSIMGFIRALLVTDVITLIILLILAFILYKWSLGETAMRICTLIIYIVSCMFGGVLLAKAGKKHAALWGLVLGCVYFSTLLLIALCLPSKLAVVEASVVLNFGICMMAGLTGAMIVRK